MNAVPPEPAQSYLQLRNRILDLNPAELGLTPTQVAPHIWGVMMEMGYEEGTATLVSLADGTTSLQYSTGGGLLGRGDYAPVAEASKSLIHQAENFLQYTSITQDFPLPDVGQVRFILLTYTGTYAAHAFEKSLVSNDHPLAPLFKVAQEALSQLRVLAEKRRK